MYQVNSAIKEWYEENDGCGVPCVHCEAQEEKLDTAVEVAKQLAADRPDEVIEIREYPGDKCVWFSLTDLTD